MDSDQHDPSAGDSDPGGVFPATPWTQLMLARGEDIFARQALGEVCRLYWYPVYAYIRSQGKSPHDAEDLTQGFFVRVLERGDLAEMNRENGRLRAFLLASIKNFLRYAWRQEHAQKRGGHQEFVSLDIEMAERRLEGEAEGGATPERQFERRWAVTLLDNTLVELRREYDNGGKREVFQRLRCFLSANAQPPTYAEVASQLGSTEQAARVAVHRLRRRYRDLLLKHISATLDEGDNPEDELAYLLNLFART